MKNIILFSDGTGNGAAKRHGTNVWKLYRALDTHRDDQVSFYDDGVGSQEFLPVKLLGGAFGFGLKRNVKDLYKSLCTNYEEGDKIYLFGFSRGAFTVRMLVGMVDLCGLYTGYKDAEELDERIENNYYRLRTQFKQTPLSRYFCDYKEIEVVDEGTLYPDIEFLGVWDTVDAYGFPIDKMARWWDKMIFPIRFPDQRLSVKVKKACHALSIDDERHTFHPVLWDEQVEERRVEDGEVAQDRIEQVWFAGAHSDVGGGYPRDSLSLVTLDWMISRAEAKHEDGPGLHLIPQKRDEIDRQCDWHGTQHDSRAGLGAYYRYKPRIIKHLCDDTEDDVHIKTVRIHRSVFERISNRGMMYAPIGLPESYQVVVTRESDSIPIYEDDVKKRERMSRLQSAGDIVHQGKNLYKQFVATSIITSLLVLTLLFWPDLSNTWKTWTYILLAISVINFIRLLKRKYTLNVQMRSVAINAWKGVQYGASQ